MEYFLSKIIKRPKSENKTDYNNGDTDTEASKSPKDTSLADQTVIISNNCPADGSDKAAVNKNLVRAATLKSTDIVDTDAATESIHMDESNTIESTAQNTPEKMLQVDGNCNNLNETCTLPRSGLQDATFVSTNNQTIVMEQASSLLRDNMEANGNSTIPTLPHTGPRDATFVGTEIFDNVEANEYFAGSQLNQTQKIGESRTDRSFSVDSLDHDGETREFSLDSPKINQAEPSTPTDKRLPAISAEKLFSSRKAPTFSEMFAGTSPTTNDLNNVTTNSPCEPSFAVDKTYVTSDNKASVNTTVVLGKSENRMPIELDGDAFEFKEPTLPTAGQSNKQKGGVDNFMVLNSFDFDFLQSRGANSSDSENDPRSSLLLRFDPLTNRRPLPSAPSRTSAPIIEGTDTTFTSSGSSNRAISCDNHSTNEPPTNGFLVPVSDAMESDSNSCMNNVRIEKNGDKVISVDELLLTNKKIDTSSVDENIRKKMEEYEATQEILLKRITEKDKSITKASNVLELYEKAIAEALATKEKSSQNYDKEHEELKADHDVNFQHLLSLESTFADLHMKFERNVQYTGQLQEKLNGIAEDKAKAEDLLRQQEFRYDKMKSHTMQQFDIANTKLEQQNRTISLENTKLRAQIKREEIHKNAVAEELSQKKKENDELVKICDELISGQRN